MLVCRISSASGKYFCFSEFFSYIFKIRYVMSNKYVFLCPFGVSVISGLLFVVVSSIIVSLSIHFNYFVVEYTYKFMFIIWFCFI